MPERSRSTSAASTSLVFPVAQHLGNRALHVLRSQLLQTKLAVSHSRRRLRAGSRPCGRRRDAHAGASRAFDRRGNFALRIQRLCPECEEGLQRCKTPLDDEERFVQCKREDTGLEQGAAAIKPSVDSLSGRGEPLAHARRPFFEPQFGVDFGRVSLHTDATADRSRAIPSFFGPTATTVEQENKHLRAHDLTHVVQQSGTDKKYLAP
jgi:Domain of unknown function (DUF4157)